MIETAIKYILDLGAPVFLPLFMTLLGVAIGMKLTKAFVSGITLGIAFTAMNLVLEFLYETISPVAISFVENTGISLTALDIGWAPMATISWSWPYAMLFFPLQLGINFLMLASRQTNTLNVDMWNVWGKSFTAILIYGATGSLFFSFLFACLQIVMELKISDVNQPSIEKITGIQGVSCTHSMSLLCVVMDPINKLLDKIPALERTMEVEGLHKKIGIFSETSVMGILIGFLFPIVSGYSLADSLVISVKVSTSLVLFPLIATLFLDALSPLAKQAEAFMKKRFKNRQIFIGMDWPILGGKRELWIISILLVPFELLLALLLGKTGINQVLPLTGIINICVVVPALIVTKGHLVKTFLLSLLFTPIFFFSSSLLAPVMTKLATNLQLVNVQPGQMVSFFALEMPIYRLSTVFSALGSPVAIGTLVLLLILGIIYVRNRGKDV